MCGVQRAMRSPSSSSTSRSVVCVAGCCGPKFSVQRSSLIGLLGAFTTFSTFANETFELLDDGQYLHAGMNVLLSNGLGLFGVWLGMLAAKPLTGS
jgi:hypothetical protein